MLSYNLIGVNWSALIVYLLILGLGVWVAYSMLNKNGLYLFSIITSLLGLSLAGVSLFSLPISVSTITVPLMFFSLYLCYDKFGKDEAKKLFYVTLISLTSFFVFKFFEAAYQDSLYSTNTFLAWENLGSYIMPIISFAVSGFLIYYLIDLIPTKKLKRFLTIGIYIAISSAINLILFSSLSLIGSISFTNILLTILLQILISAIISLGLGFFEKYFNREPIKNDSTETTKTVIEVEEQEKENDKEEDDENPSYDDLKY